MPPKAKKKSYWKKRSTKRKTNVPFKQSGVLTLVKPSVTTIKGNNTLPRQLNTKFRWAHESLLSTTAIGVAAVVGSYRINSVYQPDFGSTPGTQQPLYFDQLCPTLYNEFRVSNCFVKVVFSNPSRGDMVVGLRIRTTIAGPVTTGMSEIYLREQPNTWMHYVSDQGNKRKEFTLMLPIHKCFGIPKAQLMNEIEFAGSATANPVNNVYVEPFAICRNTNIGSVDFSIQLLYSAQMTTLINPPIS